MAQWHPLTFSVSEHCSHVCFLLCHQTMPKMKSHLEAKSQNMVMERWRSSSAMLQQMRSAGCRAWSSGGLDPQWPEGPTRPLMSCQLHRSQTPRRERQRLLRNHVPKTRRPRHLSLLSAWTLGLMPLLERILHVLKLADISWRSCFGLTKQHTGQCLCSMTKGSAAWSSKVRRRWHWPRYWNMPQLPWNRCAWLMLGRWWCLVSPDHFVALPFCNSFCRCICAFEYPFCRARRWETILELQPPVIRL